MCTIRVMPSTTPLASITGEVSKVSRPSRSKKFATMTTPCSAAFFCSAETIGPSSVSLCARKVESAGRWG